MSVPHTLTLTPNSQTFSIPPWTITAKTLPILSAEEITEAQATLSNLPLPEMPFGNNALILKHETSGWEYCFNGVEALKDVKNGELSDGDGGVKVGYAQQWLESRTDPSSFAPLSKTVPTKPFDWTYTTTYAGHPGPSSANNLKFVPAEPGNASHQIPIAELTRPDPILFYGEVELFEDELHDNGSSTMSVRVRVMPTCLFLLARFTLRVDNVLFRQYDTRIYHKFASDPPLIIRERSGWETPYDTIKASLRSPDLSPLTDPTYITRCLSSLPTSVSQNPNRPGGTGWRGLGTTTEVLFLTEHQTPQ